MKRGSIGLLASLVSATVAAQVVHFDTDTVGSAPAGWTCGVTGSGSPRWVVATDATAPSRSNVLMQSGSSSSSSLPETSASDQSTGAIPRLSVMIAALQVKIDKLEDQINDETAKGNIDMVKLLLADKTALQAQQTALQAQQTALQAQQTALQVEKNLLTQQQLQSSSSASVAASGPLLFICISSLQSNAMHVRTVSH